MKPTYDFLSRDLPSVSTSKNFMPSPRPRHVPPIFSTCLRVLYFTLRPMIHLGLTFVWGVVCPSCLEVTPASFVESLPFLHYIAFVLLRKVSGRICVCASAPAPAPRPPEHPRQGLVNWFLLLNSSFSMIVLALLGPVPSHTSSGINMSVFKNLAGMWKVLL